MQLSKGVVCLQSKSEKGLLPGLGDITELVVVVGGSECQLRGTGDSPHLCSTHLLSLSLIPQSLT